MKKYIYLFIILFIVLFSAVSISHAQTAPQDDRAALEQELSDLEKKIVQYDQDITKTQKEKNTLQNQLSVLKKKISQLDLQIKKSNLVIGDLKVQITDTQGSIVKTSSQIDYTKEKLGTLLRTMYQEDRKGSVEILLSEARISGFFDNVVALETLNQKNTELLQNIKDLKSSLESQKSKLDGDKDNLEKEVKVQTVQKNESLQTQQQQQTLLEQTKGKESAYQKMLSDAKARAAQIRAKLFQLAGGATQAPTFGDALEVAKSVGAVTGVRPAFLLAIISQESAIGRNVGQCVLVDSATGTGKKISSGALVSRLMKPSRDVQPFLSIAAALGRDPYNTPVSCPLSVGYGGAMGPAQFIPSTWNLYTGQLQSILGRAGDPWAIKDSFTTAGLYLSDLGAGSQSGEASAASRYYGGSSSYARSVMNRASCIQSFVDTGTMSASCESLIL